MNELPDLSAGGGLVVEYFVVICVWLAEIHVSYVKVVYLTG
jgi:hypothetical protein